MDFLYIYIYNTCNYNTSNINEMYWLVVFLTYKSNSPKYFFINLMYIKTKEIS